MDYTDIFNFFSNPALIPPSIAINAGFAGYAFANGNKKVGALLSMLAAFQVVVASANLHVHHMHSAPGL